MLLLRLAALCGLSSVWSKLQQAAPLQLCGCSLGVRLPSLNDIMLLVVCMAGLPSCYVSDMTAPSGTTLPGKVHRLQMSRECSVRSHMGYMMMLIGAA